LGDNEELAVGVHKGLLRHALVRGIDVGRDALAEGWVAGTSDGLETGDEVCLSFFNVEGVPCELCGRNVDARV
jgi:hypothetical protein